MMVALLVAGIGVLLGGLLAIGYGIPVKEFSFGNTLIISGAITACAGALMLGLWVVARELRVIARRLGPDDQGNPATALQPAAVRAPRNQAPDDGFLFSSDQPAVDNAGPPAVPPSPPPWHDEAASHGGGDAAAAPDEAEAAPAVKPRRNLLFSSSSRKERERASARAIDPSVLSAGPATAAPPPLVPPEPPPATFDDAWPKPDRAKATEAPLPPPRRSPRTPTTFTEAAGATGADGQPPAARKEDAPQVTVLKSGVVDGMAYSLYSDGSIEAQMPEGMMRFASIDELRAHLDQRP
jgi:hypothetical protein